MQMLKLVYLQALSISSLVGEFIACLDIGEIAEYSLFQMRLMTK